VVEDILDGVGGEEILIIGVGEDGVEDHGEEIHGDIEEGEEEDGGGGCEIKL